MLEQLQPRLLPRGYIAGIEATHQTGAIHIRQSGRLVTVVEIVSPNNKTKPDAIRDYQQRREQLIVERGVHVVEIDLTRSVKRLIHAEEASQYPYHVIVHLAGDSPRFIGIQGQLPRIALLLREDVVPLELELAYHSAYREAHLPFPSLMPDTGALDSVRKWQQLLAV